MLLTGRGNRSNHKQGTSMRMRTPARVAWAISLLFCLVAILLMPGATTVVRTHGKHTVRLITAHSLLIMASALVDSELLRPPVVDWASRWQALSGSASQLLLESCVLRC